MSDYTTELGSLGDFRKGVEDIEKAQQEEGEKDASKGSGKKKQTAGGGKGSGGDGDGADDEDEQEDGGSPAAGQHETEEARQ